MVLWVSSSRISLRLIRSSSTPARFQVSTHFLPSAICSGVQSSNAEDLFYRDLNTFAGADGEYRLGVSLAEQFTLNYGNLRVDHVAEVQLTKASKSKMLRSVRECFRMRGIFKRRHKDQQRGRLRCRLISVATDHLCQREIVSSLTSSPSFQR